MKNSRYPSPYFRFLKARLWNLTRPGFWGTAIFLSVVGLVIREFWSRPDILTRQSQPVATQAQANSTLSAEDRAVVADIDNLSVLNYDFEQSLESTLNSVEPISKPKKGNKSPLEEAISKENTQNETKLNSTAVNAKPSSLIKNPFLTQANNLLQFGNTENNNVFLGVNSLNPQSSQEDGTESSSNLIIGNRRNSFYGRNNQRNIAIDSLDTTLNQSPSNRNLSISNNSNYLNSLQTSSNQQFIPNQGNLSNSSLNSLNPNSLNNFGQQQQINILPNQGYSQSYSQSYQQGYSSPTGLSTSGVNSIPNTTGLPQTTLTNQQSISYGNNYDNNINSSYSNYNNNYSNMNSNTSLPNTTQSTQLTSPVGIPAQNYNTPYSTVPTAVQSNLPANQNINNDAVKRGLQRFDPSLFPNQVPNQ
ncbi:hypothetical protein [Brunnivagina elsteri]|uniref:Uncharacterized protein n=1 Tax=Brunnivagina elsteri CCALA 953 TaxID=987040 RepID=A0A2A2TLK2_9CYAN|nr:hypothetical protein [Calothrix elsteri]PAX58471.1 hypothetical protein CK510_07340 [Calothrix elsteri CCALA 953]